MEGWVGVRVRRVRGAQAGVGRGRQARHRALLARVLHRAVRPAAVLLQGRAGLRQRQGGRAARRHPAGNLFKPVRTSVVKTIKCTFKRVLTLSCT